MGSDLRSDADHGQPGPPSPVIAETLRSAVSLGSAESSLQALIGLLIETGPWTAGSICLLNRGGTLDSVAYLDARADECDRLQVGYGEGPAVDAVHLEPIQASPDLAAETRWTRWAPAAGRLGFRSSLTLRLFTSSTLGTVGLYSTHPGPLDADTLRAARVIAAHASVVVAAITTERHLRRAMLSRNIIGQAQGMVMHRHGLTSDRALEFLRRRSQRTNVKLVVLAGQIAATGDVPDLD